MLTLLYSDVDGHERSHEIGPDPVLVGRASDCAIRSEDARVSRHHARFYFEQGALWVEDLGSANGVYLGPNKVQRAIVPAAEVIVVGSLVLRLLPSTGTMPPPIGIHGTLAQWLSLERKNRAKLEEERNAFAQRVGELHRQMALLGDAAQARQRDEALARTVAERDAVVAERDAALARIQTLEGELADHAEWSSAIDGEQAKVMDELVRLRRAATSANEGRLASDRAATVERDDSEQMRREFEESAAAAAAELERARQELDVANSRLAVAEAQAGVVLAEKLAEADRRAAQLEDQLAEARSGAAAELARSDAQHALAELTEKLAAQTQRAATAERELAAAKVRAQGAERSQAESGGAAALEAPLAEAQAAAKAKDARIAELE
ncbi:MAG TPA: FHA domain-containing protein, partial [Kofleriaceae bacterium]|nr:FHA domain-containing protein [Kofleriaceae bacterium]